MKIKTKHDNQVLMLGTTIGLILGVVYILAMNFTLDFLMGNFATSPVDKINVVICWGVIWISTFKVTAKHSIRRLLKVFEVEFVE